MLNTGKAGSTMSKPVLIESSKSIDARDLMNAESDAVAGYMLLTKFGEVMLEVTDALNEYDPDPDHPPTVTVMFQARGRKKQ